MPNISFGPDGRAVFPRKYHGEVSLSKPKWDTICREPERHYYSLNGEKIATTLINPDGLRRHKRENSQFIYYKRFASVWISPALEGFPPAEIYFAVIIDATANRICTVYPVERPKAGKLYEPSL